MERLKEEQVLPELSSQMVTIITGEACDHFVCASFGHALSWPRPRRGGRGAHCPVHNKET